MQKAFEQLLQKPVIDVRERQHCGQRTYVSEYYTSLQNGESVSCERHKNVCFVF